jgi:outer membrane receptor protein involved in Fe transport
MVRAFRSPTLNEFYRSFRVGNVLTLANENLLAERLTGGEAGAPVGLLSDRISLRGTFFWNDITRPVANVTLQTTPALITRQRQNLGRTRSRGVEVQADAAVNIGQIFGTERARISNDPRWDGLEYSCRRRRSQLGGPR